MSCVHNILIHSSHNHLGRSFNNVKGNSIFWRGKNAIQVGNKREMINVSIDATNNSVGGDKTKEVIEAEEKYLARTYKRMPIVIVKGKGCKVYDVEGNEYLDMTSGVGVMALGHTNEHWLKALIEQLYSFIHMGNIVYTISQVGTNIFFMITIQIMHKKELIIKF